jgi:hypothetical protein
MLRTVKFWNHKKKLMLLIKNRCWKIIEKRIQICMILWDALKYLALWCHGVPLNTHVNVPIHLLFLGVWRKIKS